MTAHLAGSEERKVEIYIWHENQKVPAEVYGKARYGGDYSITVSPRAGAAAMEARASGRKAICYHFGGGITSGAGGFPR